MVLPKAMKILAAVLLAVAAFAQPAEHEIKGSVQEYGSAAPIAAAEVILKEFLVVENVVTPKVIATTLTNARGEFSFKPGHSGNFYLETRKQGYDDASLQSGTPTAEQPLSLSEKNPVGAVRFQLMRPAELVGRVVDSDGKPVARLRMTWQSPGQLTMAFRTDADGRFHLNVSPGPYIVQTTSRASAIDSEPPAGPEYDADHLGRK